jgi:hypothetical protein
MNRLSNYILYFALSISYSCGIYSFSGASIPKEAKTVSIKYFLNNSENTQPILAQILTEKLKDIFTEQTNLIISQENGDLNFNGTIKKYKIDPIAVQSNEIASKNRLTIEVSVIFKNIINPENNFNHNFSRYRDYDSGINIVEIEQELIDEITKEIIEDIFNKSVVNW